MTPTHFHVGQILVVYAFVMGGFLLSTEWVAAALGYQSGLGLPWFEILSLPVHCPRSLCERWHAFDACVPTLINKAGILAASSGLAGIVVSVTGSLWRARQCRLATTYGSFRWASQSESELEAAPLFRRRLSWTTEGPVSATRQAGACHGLRSDPKRQGRLLDLVVAPKKDADAEAVRAFIAALIGALKDKYAESHEPWLERRLAGHDLATH